jgi:hypothetical protein
MASHKTKEGECLSALASKYNLLPETIWNHADNSSLRSSRRNLDVLYAGDVVCIPEQDERFEKCATEQKNRFRMKHSLGLIVRLEIDPEDPAAEDDRFVLESTDGSYKSEKTIKDDQVPGDEYLDLHYSGLQPAKNYTLKAHDGENSDPDIIFEDVSYEELVTVSESAPEYTEPDGDDETGESLPPETDEESE